MVISVVVLFLLLGTAFVVLSNQFRRSATAVSHQRERRDDAKTLIDRAFYDLLREPSLDNTTSPLRGHSILGDMYGYGWTAPRQPAVNKLSVTASVIRVRVTNPKSDLDDAGLSLSGFDDAHNGMTLSITKIYDRRGTPIPFEPITGLITSYTAASQEFSVAIGWQESSFIERFDNLAADETFDIHVNQRSFTGTGAGVFNPQGPQTNALSTDALAPNRQGQSRSQMITSYLYAGTAPNETSSNEDYDAVDFQNMYLAGARFRSNLPTSDPRLSVTPSFYRPELTRFAGTPTIPGDLNDSLASPQRRDNFLANFLTRSGLPLFRDDDKPQFFLGIPDCYEDRDQNGTADYYQDLNGDGIADRLQDLLDANGGAGPNGVNDLSDAIGGVLNYDVDGDGKPDIMAWDVDNDGDGVLDSIWMDCGYPVQTDMKGNVYKPLVAYYVLDMDGRLNVNAHGSKVELMAAVPKYGLLNNGSSFARGQGYGPGEISLSLAGLNTSRLFTGSGSIYPGRYGFDGGVTRPAPGRVNVLDTKSAAMFANLPQDTFQNGGLVNPLFRSWMDIHGQLEVGVSDFRLNGVSQNPFNSANNSPVNVPIGLPIANATNVTNPNDTSLPIIVDSAYELDFSAASFSPTFSSGLDTAFSPGELERVLRQQDADFNSLPPRLADLLNDQTFRHSVTTDSYEVPVPPRYLPAVLGLQFPTLNLRQFFTPEVLAGKKMNLNVEWTTIEQRNLFAKSLYYITLLSTVPGELQYDYDEDGNINPDANSNGLGDDTEKFRTDIAQWVANVIDFRDGDSINSDLEFDLKPFSDENGDGNPWDSDDTLLTPPPPTPVLLARIFGAERPELLLTETLTLHDRRTEDLQQDDGVNDNFAGDDVDFDSRYVPNASTFIELYNPHFHSDNLLTNSNTEFRPSELSHPNLQGAIQINKVAPGGAPIWRLRIIKTSPGTNSNTLSPDDNPDIDPSDIARMIYFVRPTDLAVINEAGVTQKVYFPDSTISGPATPIGIQPGQRAVVGSAGTTFGNEFRTYIGRRVGLDWNTRLNETRRISLNPSAGSFYMTWWDSVSSSWRQFGTSGIVAIPIGRQYDPSQPNGQGKLRSLGLTDPVTGYDTGLANPNYGIRQIDDGYEFYDTTSNLAVTLDLPADKRTQPSAWDQLFNTTDSSAGLNEDGLLGSCFSVHLQRLANPTAAYNPANNPYLTVDYLGSDVLSFNGLTASPEQDEDTPPVPPAGGLPKAFNSFDRADFEHKFNYPSFLWKGTQDATLTAADALPLTTAQIGDSHHFPYNLEVSLGEIDLRHRQEQLAFSWLRWNNRPYVSQLELIEVPYTPQGLLPSRFHIKNVSDNPYNGVNNPVPPNPQLKPAFPNKAGQFNHLLGFHHDSVSATPSGSPSLHRVLDYVEVPSRFAGTAMNPVPAWPQPPQSINLNTFRYPGKINLNTTSDIRVFNGLLGSYGTDPQLVTDFENSRRGVGGNFPSEIPFPFRAAEFSNFVPDQSLVTRSAQTTLFRSKTPLTPSVPLFEPTSSPGAHADPNRNAYFNYDMRQRLGNLVTTRSSVFAVWVTVGFFEVDPDTQRPIEEIGIDDGTAQRYRGFYLVDRSIPVAFQPGQNHDVENCVLSSSIIQHEVQSGGRK
jgi:hypothetical protein